MKSELYKSLANAGNDDRDGNDGVGRWGGGGGGDGVGKELMYGKRSMMLAEREVTGRGHCWKETLVLEETYGVGGEGAPRVGKGIGRGRSW